MGGGNKKNEDSSSNSPLLLRHVFGFNSNVARPLNYLTETTVAYTAGHQVVLYNTETKSQRFISGNPPEGDPIVDVGSITADATALASSALEYGISAIATTVQVSQFDTTHHSHHEHRDRRLLAVAERGERATVSVHHISSSHKRHRTILQSGDCSSTEFVSVDISHDQKFVVAAGGAPDWTLVNWLWEKHRPLQSLKLTTSLVTTPNARIISATFCPTDSSLIFVLGSVGMKFYKCDQNELKSVPISLKDSNHPQNHQEEAHELLCHAWEARSDRLLVGTGGGEILVLDGPDHRKTYTTPGEASSIYSLGVYSKGFVCGCDDGYVHIFEKVDDRSGAAHASGGASHHNYSDRELYRPFKSFRIHGYPDRVLCCTISPSAEFLACSTDTSQAFVLPLSQADILKSDEMNFEPLAGFEWPHRSLTGVSTCIRKPLVVTCGLDRCIRVWNYLEKTCDLKMEFDDDPLCISLHPSGLHVLVGFSDRLRLLNLQLDKLSTQKEFGIKSCTQCRFSHGGHLFAAAAGSSIAIYTTFTSENIVNLRAHAAKVRSLAWSSDDNYLISAALDGAVLRWNALTGEHTTQLDLAAEGHAMHSVAVSDQAHTFAVGSGKTLHEIVAETNKCAATLTLDVRIDTLCMRNGAPGILFAGTHAGPIRSFQLPFSASFGVFAPHMGPINGMILSHDDHYLFSIGRDGVLCMYEVKAVSKQAASGEAGKSKTASDMAWSEEILVSKSELEERLILMKELQDKVEELTLHNEYQMRLKEMNYAEQVRALTEKYEQECEGDAQKYALLQNEKNELEHKYQRKMKELEQAQHDESEELHEYNERKLEAERQRYEELEQVVNEQQKRWELEAFQRDEQNTKEAQELEEAFQKQIEHQRKQAEATAEAKRQLLEEFESVKTLIEEDADKEIDVLKETYDSKLANERQLTLRLSGNNGVLKAKFAKMQARIKKQRDEIVSMVNEERTLYERIGSLEKDIEGYQKEISERDSTISDKDKRINDLRKKNQELEKFKFVLDYKIRELKRQIEPREREIERTRQQLDEMLGEVRQYRTDSTVLSLDVKQLKLKLSGMQNEVDLQDELVKTTSHRVEGFRHDLHALYLEIENQHALKRGVVQLYHRYQLVPMYEAGKLTKDNSKESKRKQVKAKEQGNVHADYQRHRIYLEKSVQSLQRKLGKDAAVHKTDNSRILQENVTLLQEINELRRDIKFARQMVGQSEQFKSKESSGEDELDELRDEVEVNERKIQRLRNQLGEMNKLESSKGKSRAAPPEALDEYTPSFGARK